MLIYSEKYKLRESDFDYRDNMRASAYLDIFQTIAAKHATMLGLGFKPMMEKGIAWVVTKIKFDCFKPLAPDETITAETRPHPKGIIDYVRDYYLYSESGELAAKGTSQWVLIDFKSRKIVKPEVDFNGRFTDEYAYESKRIERIQPISDPVFSYSHKITRSELDHNEHTNNIRYADMIFNAVDTPSRPIKQATVNFLSESKLGDTLNFACVQNDVEYRFTGFKNDEPCFTALLKY